MLTAYEIKSFTCINCPLGCLLEVSLDTNGVVYSILGNECKLGATYATSEATTPKRMLCAVLNIDGAVEPLSVKTSTAIDKGLLVRLMDEIKALNLSAPIKSGDVVVANALDSGVDIIATKSIDRLSVSSSGADGTGGVGASTGASAARPS